MESKEKEMLMNLIEELVGELDDAIGFLEGFEDCPDETFGEEGIERLNRKRDLVEKAFNIIKK